METMSLNTLDWARMEFSEAQLGDVVMARQSSGIVLMFLFKPPDDNNRSFAILHVS